MGVKKKWQDIYGLGEESAGNELLYVQRKQGYRKENTVKKAFSSMAQVKRQQANKGLNFK